MPSSSAASDTRPIAPAAAGLATDLRHIRQTELYNGFMRSSPKITLTLGIPPADGTDTAISSLDLSSRDTITSESASPWICAVCEYSNSASTNKCALCGVSGHRKAVSGSLPASTPATPDRAGTPRQSIEVDVPANTVGASAKSMPTEIACPVCTFLNHASMRNCEICSTALPRLNGRSTSAAIPTGAPSAGVPGLPDSSSTSIIRLSFRKDGSKVAYSKLKSVLGQKAWERDVRVSALNTP